jgi:hypothetical protein
VGKSYKKFVGNATYLKKEDLSEPVDTDLLSVKEEKVTAPGKGTQTRLVAYFDGLSKGLVINMANADTLAELTGTDDYDKWGDTPVQLYVDPEVKYGGKKTGGIRIRKCAPGLVPIQEPELVQDPF